MRGRAVPTIVWSRADRKTASRTAIRISVRARGSIRTGASEAASLATRVTGASLKSVDSMLLVDARKCGPQRPDRREESGALDIGELVERERHAPRSLDLDLLKVRLPLRGEADEHHAAVIGVVHPLNQAALLPARHQAGRGRQAGSEHLRDATHRERTERLEERHQVDRKS